MKEGRDELGRFKKGFYQGNGFRKGFHPRTEFKVGHHPPTEFKKGHKLNCGKHNPMFDVHRFGESSPNWKGGISLTRKGLAFPKSF
jgi:hypothetical protein